MDFVYFLAPGDGRRELPAMKICFADGGQAGNQFASQIGYINFPNVNCLSVSLWRFMEGKFVKNIKVPINIFNHKFKNPLSEAIWENGKAE